MAGTRFGGRTLARSQALQLLFQAEATNRLVSEVLAGDYALDEGPLDTYAEELARGCDAMLHELDAVIGVTSSNWSISRISAVDRNLLRLALYEMMKVDEVDVAVAIDECVELAKAYGTDDSSRFVNGVLGKVAHRLEAGEDVIASALEAMADTEDDDEDEVTEDDADFDEDDDFDEDADDDDAADDESSEDDDDVDEDDESETDAADDDLPDWARE